MIDSWNAAKLNERINQVEQKIQANDVIANPTGDATAELNKISIDGTIYSNTDTHTSFKTEHLSVDNVTVPASGSYNFNLRALLTIPEGYTPISFTQFNSGGAGIVFNTVSFADNQYGCIVKNLSATEATVSLIFDVVYVLSSDIIS